MVPCITSRENAAVKYACKVRDDAAFRRAEGVFFAEGVRLCEELARAFRPYKVYYLDSKRAAAEALGGQACEVSLPVAQKLAGTRTPQGLFALFPCPAPMPQRAFTGKGRYLCLERVQDPSNLGALLRSAAAFGFDAVALSPGCADAFSQKALRASMGAAGKVPVAVVPQFPAFLRALGEKGCAVYAAALQNSRPLAEAVPPAGGGLALVIGNEGAGLSPEAVAAAGMAVRIPMTGAVESLNAAVAGSILLWHFRGVGI